MDPNRRRRHGLLFAAVRDPWLWLAGAILAALGVRALGL